MRFRPNGPIVPSHLLEQRNEGNVIFFCGAGISRRAGLPDFSGLTRKVVEKLSTEKVLAALERDESYDRIFRLLVHEFGQSEIDREIYSALKSPRKPTLACHETILELSRGVDGRSQIVTTNFDLLFEAVDKGIPRIVPPALPDLSLQQSINGLVYLHGRLRKPEVGVVSGYIISSADFGRAYLSEGWATRFVKTLRERYTIVLLGYRAEDPPMRYLLEGLNSADGVSYASPIYAFTPGDEGDAEEEWQDRGVTPICYSGSADHAALWDTLSAWADAVRNPEQWTERVLTIARKRPTEVAPHERGQVVELVRTKHGAKRFADAKPSPSAEWMCVFDPSVRYAEPLKTPWDDEKEVDPLDIYGLDDDAPRPQKEVNGQRSIPGFSPLNWKIGDASYPERVGLRGWHPQSANPLPERLHHIARWFGDVMHEPVAVWWAAGWKQLNPNMLWFVVRRLGKREADLPQEAVIFWRLYLEACDHVGVFDHDYVWFEFRSMVRKEGWSSATLRFLERVSQPHVEFSRPSFGHAYPVEATWTDLPLRRLIDVKVKMLDRHNEKLDIPDEHLSEVIAVARRSLLAAASLLDDIGTAWWQMPTLHPTGERGKSFHGRKTLYFLWFRDLFVRLVSFNPAASSIEAAQWRINDKYFFGKLSIFAAMYREAMSADKVVELLQSLDDQLFWEPRCQRELLITLRTRWPDLAFRQRRAIERRILKGPARRAEEKTFDFRRRKAVYSAERLAWLEISGCCLTSVTAKRLPALKGVDPNWSDDWAREADRSFDSRGGVVERVTNSQGLEVLPIGMVLQEAQKKTEHKHRELREYRPFEGFVKSKPFRALAALRFDLRKGNAQTHFWETLLSNWPDGTSLRLRWLVAHTLTCLSVEALVALRFYVPRWFEKHLAGLVESDRSRAFALFDKIAAAYIAAASDMTKSAIGHTTVGGVVQDRSEVSIDKAINSPIGELAQALWQLMPDTATKKGPLPGGIGERLKSLFAANGDGGGHAVCVVAQHFVWLDHWFPKWSHRVLRPMFEIEHSLSEAVWHGYAASSGWPSTKTLRVLCPSLLGLLRGEASWTLNESEKQHLVQQMVVLTRPNKSSTPLISFVQARVVLIALDDKGRSDAVSMLTRIIADVREWTKFVKPFIEDAWPRQLRFRTDSVCRNFAYLIEQSSDAFPEAVRTIVPLLRPVAHLDMITYRLSKEPEEGTHDFAQRFPAETLLLLDALVADDRSQMPYELGKALEVIAEANSTLRRTREWRRLSELTV